MEKKILIILTILLVNNSFISSQETEYITFKHKALFLNVKYPSTWTKYWYYDEYSDKDYFDLSRNKTEEMIIKYSNYPMFYIKKYDEIYNGINPSIRITLQPHRFNIFNIKELIMALYNGEHEKFYLYSEYINQWIDILVYVLSKGKTITQEINRQCLWKESVLHFKTEDYVLDSDIPNEDFNRITEYILYIEDDYTMIIEINYSKTIDINDKNELMEIIRNIRIK
ncbi:MAG: hypothetical protein LBV17_08105 [Treponema sp.]|jgi:hypothetical protein|nr:hypothetical protein [Treponema sp.]